MFGSRLSALAQIPESKIGLFESHGDVGTVLHDGSVKHDASKETYTLTASGEKLVERTRKYIVANPLQSFGLALAAGYLISRITR